MSHEDVFLHVHDLPQLYQKPTLERLVETLNQLKIQPTSFQDARDDITRDEGLITDAATTTATVAKINPAGVPRYLTSIVSSSLAWLEDDTARELVWDLASARLSERAGRTAMPSMTRSFTITPDLSITLFEPSLTEDNLGFKTWTSSLLLAKRLALLREHIPRDCRRVLELGAGTGLVGMAVGCVWGGMEVVLTDLQDIVPNLRRNVEANHRLIGRYDSHCSVRTLDWSDESCVPSSEADRFEVIVAADPIYTAEHPKMLVNTVQRWLDYSDTSRFIVELPVRDGYGSERDDLKVRLHTAGMEMIEDGNEMGYDDWQGSDGQPAEVECWWSVWKPILSANQKS